jgi:hypothetical protein
VLATLGLVAAAITVQSPAPVQALAADGPRAAYAAGFSVRDRTRGVSKLGRRTNCEQTSTGNAISSLALAGTRALWLHYAGGNRRLYTVWTATTARPRPLLLASREVDVDNPAPIVVGAGDTSRFGDLLPYAVGDTVRVLRANGARAFSWRASARVTALGAEAGEIAVGTADGSVTVLDARGRVLRRLPSGGRAPTAVFVGGDAVVVQRGNVVERNGTALPVPNGARILDVQGSRVAYVLRGRLFAYDTVLGRTTSLGRGTLVQLEPDRTVLTAGRTVTTR